VKQGIENSTLLILIMYKEITREMIQLEKDLYKMEILPEDEPLTEGIETIRKRLLSI
ncbi:hypothetical protein MHK_000663, partial [Candidatus Magnetomorum sp. HK-1]